MSDWWFQTILREIILLLPVMASLIQFKILDKASKHIFILLLLYFLVETIAAWAALTFKQNNIVYNIHSPIDLFIICLYFNTIIDRFREKHIGFIIGTIGVILAIINATFIQDPFILNTYFLAVQSLLVVFMSLFYFYDFLLKDRYDKKLPIHFWFTSLLLIYWNFTLFQWLIGLSSINNYTIISEWSYYIIFGINTIVYISFALLFFNYNKFSHRGE